MEQQAKIEFPTLLTQQDLCTYLGKSGAWAERARLEGNGPPFVKIGRSVRYRAVDVEDWIQSRMRRQTAASRG